jgi:2,4-dienoyl-CoA reductase-like NADH-dependent reductase (Old Yellow Enzyme family)
MPTLFDPIRLGAITARNRIFMAPMTRGRATSEHVPTLIMARYYEQRASAGLIISEAIGISRQGMGWPFAPGLWTQEQIEGWRPVTRAVHQAGGLIIAQLWHMGRLVHPDLLDGAAPVSASATTAPGEAHTYEGRKPHVEARPLRVDEMPGIAADYASAARNAMEAGFDGVQIHAANGYLIDQFLRDSSNLREDEYGGSVDNRIRLLVEVTQAVVDTVGADRTGVRFSPNGEVQGVRDSDPVPLFTAAAAALSRIGIAHLELKEPPLTSNYGDAYMEPIAPLIRPVFDGPLILNADYDVERAAQALQDGNGDAISFGRPFIANPDLPRRIAEALDFAADNRATWLGRGGEGYDDYLPHPELNHGAAPV